VTRALGAGIVLPALLALTMSLGVDSRAEEPGDEGPLPKEVRGDVVPPKILSKVDPKYPERARASKLEAKVLVKTVIEEDGSVGKLEIHSTEVWKDGETEPDPELDGEAPQFEAAAKAAVARWRYEPATENGAPIRVVFFVVVAFSLG
jgi:protein TonB